MSNISVKSASCPSGYTFKTCRLVNMLVNV